MFDITSKIFFVKYMAMKFFMSHTIILFNIIDDLNTNLELIY